MILMKKIKQIGAVHIFAVATIMMSILSTPSRLFADTCPPGTLCNPTNVDDLTTFVKKILDIVLTIGIPIVALAIIYSGFLFVQARGNSEALTKAKKTLVYTLVGAAILLGAWILAQAIGDTVGELRKAV